MCKCNEITESTASSFVFFGLSISEAIVAGALPTFQPHSHQHAESNMKEKHIAALIRRNHDFFDSPRYPLNAGKHNPSFFSALVLRRWRGPLPCCLCSRQCCTSKRHLSCKMQKEFSFEKCSQCSFFTFIKTGAFLYFFT